MDIEIEEKLRILNIWSEKNHPKTLSDVTVNFFVERLASFSRGEGGLNEGDWHWINFSESFPSRWDYRETLQMTRNWILQSLIAPEMCICSQNWLKFDNFTPLGAANKWYFDQILSSEDQEPEEVESIDSVHFPWIVSVCEWTPLSVHIPGN